MKTKKVILTIMVFVLTGFAIKKVSAGGPELTDVIKNAINENVKYPEFAIEKSINGVVVVQFKINKNGNVEVKRINSLQPELEEYVHNKLETISFNPATVDTTESYYYKFNFDLL